MKNVKFLPKVIEYDRYQPEFYEDTKTYISKRTSSKKVLLGKEFYEKNFKLINSRHIIVKTPEGRWASDHHPILAKLKF